MCAPLPSLAAEFALGWHPVLAGVHTCFVRFPLHAKPCQGGLLQDPLFVSEDQICGEATKGSGFPDHCCQAQIYVNMNVCRCPEASCSLLLLVVLFVVAGSSFLVRVAILVKLLGATRTKSFPTLPP